MTAHGDRHVYPMAPVIRGTLIALYLSLVLPLPLVATGTARLGLLVAVPMGLVLVLAATSERVELDEERLSVGHPAWCAWLMRRNWSLPWKAVSGLTPFTTSQGGRVFYIHCHPASAERAFLLPQRVARFEDFLVRFAAASGLDTSGIARLTPPWTYQLLAALSVLLLAGELLALGLFHSPSP